MPQHNFVNGHAEITRLTTVIHTAMRTAEEAAGNRHYQNAIDILANANLDYNHDNHFKDAHNKIIHSKHVKYRSEEEKVKKALDELAQVQVLYTELCQKLATYQNQLHPTDTTAPTSVAPTPKVQPSVTEPAAHAAPAVSDDHRRHHSRRRIPKKNQHSTEDASTEIVVPTEPAAPRKPVARGDNSHPGYQPAPPSQVGIDETLGDLESTLGEIMKLNIMRSNDENPQAKKSIEGFNDRPIALIKSIEGFNDRAIALINRRPHILTDLRVLLESTQDTLKLLKNPEPSLADFEAYNTAGRKMKGKASHGLGAIGSTMLTLSTELAFYGTLDKLKKIKVAQDSSLKTHLDEFDQQTRALFIKNRSTDTLLEAARATLQLLENEARDEEDFKTYDTVANKVHGHPIVGLQILGSLMLTIGAAVAALALLVATGVFALPALPIVIPATVAVFATVESASVAAMIAGGLSIFGGSRQGPSKTMERIKDDIRHPGFSKTAA